MIVDLSYPHDYAVSVRDLPSGDSDISTRYFRAPDADSAAGWSFLVEIRPKGCPPWFGFFAGDSSLRTDCSVVMSTPDPSRLLAIANGQSFLVQVDDPSKVAYPKCFPVHQALTMMSHDIIVLANPTDLVAIGRSGVVWQSGRLVTDDLRLVSTTGDVIEATGWVGSDGDVEFSVDPRTGRIIGRPFLD